MNMPHPVTRYNVPAWISAGAALLIAGIAAWSIAASPSQKTLEQHAKTLSDHEQRIRFQENLTAQELSAINAKLDSLMRRDALDAGDTP
jgi:uncharacterized protein YdhG (YjbR/CyaY superfamily)